MVLTRQDSSATQTSGGGTTVVVQSSQHSLKLKGASNWCDWKYVTEMRLQARKLQGCIKTRISEAHLADTESAEYEQDFQARLVIVESLSEELIRHVRTHKTAFDAWAALCNTYEDKGVHQRCALYEKFSNCHHKNFSTLGDYVMECRHIMEQVASTGKVMDDEMAAWWMLKNLREEYSTIRALTSRQCASSCPTVRQPSNSKTSPPNFKKKHSGSWLKERAGKVKLLCPTLPDRPTGKARRRTTAPTPNHKAVHRLLQRQHRRRLLVTKTRNNGRRSRGHSARPARSFTWENAATRKLKMGLSPTCPAPAIADLPGGQLAVLPSLPP
ncbi:uncharacterized protein LOC117648280 [Thrips palmi]|uniref:Uncharacterized protein LOC117648280 n=1 Tax=Thrips palmi TaxID=161013 RepID=A0A6P8ZCP5_THRPL|nr:uncharacterized protein LOC117648280 [Thrips palmi]